MRRGRKFLISAVLVLIIFALIIFFNVQRQDIKIHNIRTVFDDKLANFDATVFENVIPYFDKLIEHYGYIKIKSEGYSETVRQLDESVKRYVLNPKIDNFKEICQVLEEIRKQNKVKILSELINFKAGPLTLAIFFLSPLPTTFKSHVQPQILTSKMIMNDKILKYLSVLRSANIYRGIITSKTWFEVYDNKEFIKEYGNVLSLKDNNIYELIRELEISNYSAKLGDFDEVMKDSKADYRTIEMQSKLRLDLSIEDVLASSKDENNSNVIIIKTPENCAHYYTQILEKLKVKVTEYQLKAMVVIKKGKQVLMVFDDYFQFWNMFDGENVLSMPRPFARKYYTEHGSRLIYVKVKV